MTRRKASAVPALDLTLYAGLTDEQRAILDGADPVSRPILLGLFRRAQDRASAAKGFS